MSCNPTCEDTLIAAGVAAHAVRYQPCGFCMWPCGGSGPSLEGVEGRSA